MTRWIQDVNIKKGALHRQLGYPEHEKLPLGLLKEIDTRGIGARVRGYHVTPLLWHRVHAAVNMQKRRG